MKTTQVLNGKFRVVKVTDDVRTGNAIITPISEWMPVPPHAKYHIPKSSELVKGTEWEGTLFGEGR